MYAQFLDKCSQWFDPELSVPAAYSVSAELGHTGTFHIHVYVQHTVKVDRTVASFYEFAGCHPDCRPNTARGKSAKEAVRRGHYYCQMRNKIGVLWKFATHPIEDPSPAWFKKWYEAISEDPDGTPQQKYLTRHGYREALLHYNLLTDHIERTLRLHNKAHRKEQLSDAMIARQQAVKASMMPFQYSEIIWDWLAHYQRVDMRYKFLVVEGPSQLGKTQAYKALFNNPFIHEEELYWAKGDGYDWFKNDAVLFDDVKGLFKHILAHKTTFQANNDTHVVQMTPSAMYADEIYLCAKPMVILWNNDEQYEPNENEWLCKNIYSRVVVSEPTYCQTRAQVVQELIRRERCLTGTLRDQHVQPLVAWLENHSPTEEDLDTIRRAGLDVQFRHQSFGTSQG